MKYKVGDKVLVRRDLKSDKCYGYWALSEMLDLKGTGVTIRSVSIKHNYYEVCEMNGVAGDEQWWTDEMFEGLAEEPAPEPQEDWNWQDLF